MDNDVFEKLKALQDILAKKNALETAIIEAPKALVTGEELLEKLKTGFIEKHSESEELRKSIADLKAALFEAETKREQSEKAMDTIETQREYEVLQKEIDEATAKETSVRKELQKLESDFRMVNAALKQEEALIEQNDAELKEKKQKLDSEVADKKAELEVLKKEEEKLSPSLSGETMFKFDRIIKNKNGVGIVPVRGTVCMGCHMILPAQFVNEVRADTDIKFCPYCSRVLFYEESDVNNEQEAFFDDSDMGGLADLEDLPANSILSDFENDNE